MVVIGLVLVGCLLGGCASFCDQEDPDWSDPFYEARPMGANEHYNRRGDRCVNATIFDVVDGLRDAD